MVSRRALGLALLALIFSAEVASHAVLRASTPPPHGQLPAGASVLALHFSETVETDHTSVTLVDSQGLEIPAASKKVAGEPQLVNFTTAPLAPGAYTLRWDALSVDGDITRGSFPFSVGEPESPSLVLKPIPAWQPPPDEARTRLITGLLRALRIGSALLLAGAAFLWLDIQRSKHLSRRATTVLLFIATLGVTGAMGGLLDLAQRLNASPVATLETTAGKLLLAMTLLAAAQWLVALRLARGRGSAGALIALGAVSLLVNTIAGHVIAGDDLDSAMGDLMLFATLAHVMAASIWVGGVLALMVLAWQRQALAPLMRAFSRWAIVSVVLIAASGLVMALSALTHPQELISTDYGRLIALKIIGFTVLLGFGGWHRFGRGTPTTLSAEFGLMLLVVGLASVLAVSPLPAEPVSTLAGPAVGQARDLDFGDYQGRLLLPDPLTTRPEQTLWLQLRSKRFADLGASPATLSLTAPASSAFGTRQLKLEPLAAGRWRARGPLFPIAGEWVLQLRVEGPRGTANTELVISVGESG